MSSAHRVVASFDKLAFIPSDTDEAKVARDTLVSLYGEVDADDADVIVTLGGDGLMLATLHRFMNSDKPIYGMNRGSVGFLMNEYRPDALRERLSNSIVSAIHPLLMTAIDAEGKTHKARAINEVSLLRQTYQAAKLRLGIDGKVRLEELICDGVMVATPAGSTAYNLSAHGPILPIHAPLLALTPISPFRPRRWRGAVVPDRCSVTIEVLEHEKRPVSAAADHTEIRQVISVHVKEDHKQRALILFDRDHSWDERILAEQFRY
jgi:NAD+ kinase